MKVKTSDLRGAALDWAVAAARDLSFGLSCGQIYLPNSSGDFVREYSPSSNWAHGGPLIDSFKVDIYWHERYGGGGPMFEAHCGTEFVLADRPDTVGETALIAICRAIVLAKLGDEVEIPDELCEVRE